MNEQKSDDNVRGHEDLIEKVKSDDTQAILEYGIDVQSEMADFSADLLDQMRSAKTGDIEYPLERLVAQIQSTGIESLVDTGGGKRALRKAEKALSRFNKIDQQVFRIEMELDAVRGDLLRDIIRLKKLKEKNETHRTVLEGYINAAEQAIEKVKEISKSHSAVNLLEKRAGDLKLARMISLQTSPQIDLIIRSDESLAERISTSLLSMIPIWRSQMLIAKALLRQKDAERIEQTIMTETAGRLESNNAVLREEIERMKSAGDGAWNRLEQTSSQLLKTIDRCREASQDEATEIAHAQTQISKLRQEIIADSAEKKE